MSNIDFTILDKAIEKFGNEEKSLIAILQEAQEFYRYLPKEIFPYLATKLNLSEAKIFGVTSGFMASRSKAFCAEPNVFTKWSATVRVTPLMRVSAME